MHRKKRGRLRQTVESVLLQNSLFHNRKKWFVCRVKRDLTKCSVAAAVKERYGSGRENLGSEGKYSVSPCPNDVNTTEIVLAIRGRGQM